MTSSEPSKPTRLTTAADLAGRCDPPRPVPSGRGDPRWREGREAPTPTRPTTAVGLASVAGLAPCLAIGPVVLRLASSRSGRGIGRLRACERGGTGLVAELGAARRATARSGRRQRSSRRPARPALARGRRAGRHSRGESRRRHSAAVIAPRCRVPLDIRQGRAIALSGRVCPALGRIVGHPRYEVESEVWAWMPGVGSRLRTGVNSRRRPESGCLPNNNSVAGLELPLRIGRTVYCRRRTQ